MGVWKELPNFECAYCVYSTTSEKRMLLHLAQRHPGQITAAAQERKQPPVIYDALGRLMKPQGTVSQVTQETEGGLDNG